MNALPISARLLLSYLLVAVLPLTGMALFYLDSFEASLRATLLDNMGRIANKKTGQIDSYLSERLADARQLSQQRLAQESINDFGQAFRKSGTQSPAYQAVEQRLRRYLTIYTERADYWDLLLIDTAGNVIFSIAREADLGSNLKSGPYRTTELARGFELSGRTLQTQLTRFAPYAPSGNRPAAFLVAPVLKNGIQIGTIALQVDLAALESVTADSSGLGRSGETVLAQKDGNEAYYTVPLKHRPDAAYRYRVPLQKAALPMQQALSGNYGQGSILDYAGIKCIAAWRYLPALRWGMVVKVDEAEALAPVVELRRTTYIALALFLILSGAAAYFLGRRLSRPIRNLTHVAERIAEGDFSQRAPQDGSDELDRMANAFNHMAETLIEARSDLEAKVLARTEALANANQFQEAIILSLTVPTFLLDAEHRVIAWNRACEELTGVKAEDIVGTMEAWRGFYPAPRPCLADIVIDQSLDKMTQLYMKVGESKFSHGLHAQQWFDSINGKRRYLTFEAVPIHDHAGKLVAVIETFNDITEIKLAEEELSVARDSAETNAESLSAIFATVVDGIIQIDEHGRIIRFNSACEAMFGYTIDEMLGENVNRLMPEPYHSEHDQYLSNYRTTGNRKIIGIGREVFGQRKDGTTFPVELSVGEAHHAGERMFIGVIHDITARKNAEKQLALMATVFQSSGEAILISDADNNILGVNEAFTKLTGYTLDEVRGRNPKLFASGRTPEETYQEMWNALHEKDFWQGELWDKHKDGHDYPKWVSITVVHDAQGNITNHIASFTDMTERKAAQDKIHYLAHHDVLTQLPNRFTLTERLQQALSSAQRNKEKVAVMFLDLDRFKTINDSLGHDVGDQLLIQVAQRLKSCVRASDIIARLGGDEFVVAATEIEHIDTVFHLADKILQTLGQPYSIAGHAFNSSPSIGIALFPEDGATVEEVMKNADVAMYHAKQMGRNNYQYFESSMNKASAERLELENDLRLGLERNEFVLYYQPQISLKTGRVVGVEALVRWDHPIMGRISPMTFIPIAEESGLILPLGEWILRTACRQLKAFADAGMLDIRMSVNLSARQFGQKTLAQTVARYVAKDDIDPEMLELEITESVTMNSPQDATAMMWMLRGIGVKIAIDDFGTGYSSLSYLKKFPVSRLKIDRSFVKDIETDPNDAAICTATIALAHTLGLDVVAEGVETEVQHDYLKRLGCDVIQGYYFSQPLLANEIATYIAERHSVATFLTEAHIPANVLVIDDDETVCNFLKHVLEHIRHKPTAESYPAKALELVRQNPGRFGLIIADLVMPGMSGVDLVKAIREVNRDVPIIVATAFDADETRKAFRPLEKDYNLIPEVNYFVLEKPLLIEDVCAVVNKAIPAGISQA